MTPAFGLVPPLPYPVDFILFGVFLALLAGVAILRSRAAGLFVVAALALAVFFVLEDVSRLQPWFYQYSFMLAAVGLYGLGRLGTEDALNACRLIVACTYLWSGLQKANAGFVENVYPEIVEPLASYLPLGIDSALSWGAYAVPAIEAAIGLGLLLTRRLRTPAVVAALLMHAFILFSIGPFGSNWNTVVWPWNVAMVAFGFIMFWRTPDEPSFLEVLRPSGMFRVTVLVLFALMPALNFFELWDSYLSANLYSGNTKEGYVLALDDSHWTQTRITYLAMEEMNVPAYPEERVFKNVFKKKWCGSGNPSFLVVYGTPRIFSGERSEEIYRCADVRQYNGDKQATKRGALPFRRITVRGGDGGDRDVIGRRVELEARAFDRGASLPRSTSRAS
ncbi:MAG: hypothetical protein M3M97_05370 [Actinomycetota bacterium]|nr:hypothetical protein [Actinomycetota bacterium]